MRQLHLSIPHRMDLTADAFVVSDANRAAWEQVMGAWPVPFCYLSGAKASGKTHLAYIWAERNHARFVPAENLTREQVADVVAEGEATQPWVVENIHALRDEAALFHLINAVREQGGRLLVTSRHAPGFGEVGLKDLSSRLLAMPHCELMLPDAFLLEAVLQKLFDDRQLRVPAEVIRFMAGRMERSYAEARRLVEKVDAHALEHKRKITVPLVKEVMGI